MEEVRLETKANQPQLVIAKINAGHAFDAVENLLRNAYLSRGIEFPSSIDSGTAARKLMTRVGNTYDRPVDYDSCLVQPYQLHVDMYYHPDSNGGRVHMYFLADTDGLVEEIAQKERNFFADFYCSRLENGRR